MNSAQRDNLKDEVARGDRAKRAMQEFILPFIKEKSQVIYENFKAISVTDTEKLMECKRQDMVLEALQIEIQSIIDTGKMASKSLSDVEEKEE